MSDQTKAQILITIIFIAGIILGSWVTIININNDFSILEACINREDLDDWTPYVQMGDTIAVFIENEQGTHVVKMCDEL